MKSERRAPISVRRLHGRRPSIRSMAVIAVASALGDSIAVVIALVVFALLYCLIELVDRV